MCTCVFFRIPVAWLPQEGEERPVLSADGTVGDRQLEEEICGPQIKTKIWPLTILGEPQGWSACQRREERKQRAARGQRAAMWQSGAGEARKP